MINQENMGHSYPFRKYLDKLRGTSPGFHRPGQRLVSSAAPPSAVTASPAAAGPGCSARARCATRSAGCSNWSHGAPETPWAKRRKLGKLGPGNGDLADVQWEIFRILKWRYISTICLAIFWGYIP